MNVKQLTDIVARKADTKTQKINAAVVARVIRVLRAELAKNPVSVLKALLK